MAAAAEAWDRVFGDAVGIAVAADGMWEDAVRLPLGTDSGVTPAAGADLAATADADADADAADERFGRWLARAGSDVAIEVGFATGAFVGVRLRPAERDDALAVVTALRRDLGTRAASGTVTASRAMAAIDRAAAPRFHHTPPDHAELGVLDRWRSLGHLRLALPVPADPPLGAPGVPADAPGPIILETAFGPDSGGWLGAPVSAPSSGPRHDIDPARWREVALLPTDLCLRGDCRGHR